jgi:ribosomal protein L27
MLLLPLLMIAMGCKTINVTVITTGDVEILIDQRGSDVKPDLEVPLG